MKKIITITILLFSMASYAQGNLQFNRVRTYTGSIYRIFDTVPQGKVWKIESTGISGGTNYSGGNYTGFLTINNSPYSNTSSQGSIKEIIWLKEGDFLGWNGGTVPYFVSLIEYNIIP